MTIRYNSLSHLFNPPRFSSSLDKRSSASPYILSSGHSPIKASSSHSPLAFPFRMFPIVSAWAAYLSIATTIIMAQPRVLVFTYVPHYFTLSDDLSSRARADGRRIASCLSHALGACRRTTGYRHDSIPTAIQALQAQSAQQQNATATGEAQSVSFDFTEDPTRFTDENLGGYDAVMFISTTGDDGEPSRLPSFIHHHPASIQITHPLAYNPTLHSSQPRPSSIFPHVPPKRWQFHRGSFFFGLFDDGRMVCGYVGSEV
jgi:hypothetical protein